MLPGPVFNIELITTARRARYFVIRAVYALILLIVLWQNYQAATSWGRSRGQEVTINEMASLAQSIFWSFAITQAVAVALLTPVLLGGVISDEKQRRTLHYLMASQLTSAEIILGKLMARLIHLGVFLAVGLPVLSLITLFGGIDPRLVGLAYLMTITGGLFLAGLSILVSTYARSVRESITTIFLLAIVFLVLPLLLDQPLRSVAPSLHAAFAPVNAWFLAASPFAMLNPSAAFAPGTSPEAMLAWMIGLQLGFGSLFVGLAIWRLRPVFRMQSGEASREGSFWRRLNRPWRIAPRPTIGDRPMLWKELHVVRSGGLGRWVIRFCAVVGFGLLAYWVLHLSLESAREFWRGLPSSGYQSAMAEFNGWLRGITGLLYVIWILGVVASACASITSEKEEDTWLSLIATPLTGREILFSKMFGAAWSLRALGATMLGLWVIGMLTGAVHPVGLGVTLIEWAIFTWFAAALGVSLSMQLRNTTQATVAAIAILIVLNGGYLLCCIPLRADTMLVASGCTPFIMASSLMSYEDFWRLGDATSMSRQSRYLREAVAMCFLGSFAYLAAAFMITSAALGRFDAVAGRPSPSRLDQQETTTDKEPANKKYDDLEEIVN